jgi:hypothetical protein
MLRLAASLPGQAHVSLGDAITGIDEHYAGLLIKSVRTPPDDASFSPQQDPAGTSRNEPGAGRRENSRQLNTRSHQ